MKGSSVKDSVKDVNLQRAFHLAYFLFNDRPSAIQVVIQSLDKLEVTAQRQVKRLKHIGKKPRTKALLGDMQLIQKLICHHADQFQRIQEMTYRPVPPTEWQMTIRWIQQLVMLGDSNSFHATVAICRILHFYSTSESRDVYEILLQEPGRGKSDDEYRRAKSRITNGLLERFSDQVRLVSRGFRGEEGFDSVDSIGPALNGLTEECLSRLAIWDVQPVEIPENLSITNCTIPGLESEGTGCDAESDVERRRLHTVVDPAKFEQLTRSLKMTEPASALLLPRFTKIMTNNDKSGQSVANYKAPDLVSEEMEGIRKVVSGRLQFESLLEVTDLTVRIDGVERARFRIAGVKRPSIRFSINSGDRTVEILAVAEQTIRLVAFWFVECGADGSPLSGVYPVTLTSGDRLSVEVSQRNGDADSCTAMLIVTRPASALDKVAEMGDRIVRLLELPSLQPIYAHRIRVTEDSYVQPVTDRYCPDCGRILRRASGPAWECQCGFFVMKDL